MLIAKRLLLVVAFLFMFSLPVFGQEKDRDDFKKSTVAGTRGGTLAYEIFLLIHNEDLNLSGLEVQLRSTGNITDLIIRRNQGSCLGASSISDKDFAISLTHFLQLSGDYTALYWGRMFDDERDPNFTEFRWSLIYQKKAGNLSQAKQAVIEACENLRIKYHKNQNE